MGSPGFRPRARGVMAVAVLVAACGGSEPDVTPLTGSGSAGSAGDTSGGEGSEGPLLDLADGDEGPTSTGDEGGSADECTNVDILFVIDNSASMADQQESLIASFEGFVAGIESNLALAESYHVGVVSTDGYAANPGGCNGLGDLVTQTGGLESSACVGTPFTTGLRYMDQTEVDLTAKFKCVADLGVGGGDDEKVAAAVLGAIDPANNGAGACNEGFARLDSLLVIVIITDEDDVAEPYMCDPDDPFGPNPCDTTGSGGTPQEWYEAVVAAKGGMPENVAVLALLGEQADNACGAVVASKLIGFANRFGVNGFTGDVCASSYDQFFAAALPIVDQACENFVPIP